MAAWVLLNPMCGTGAAACEDWLAASGAFNAAIVSGGATCAENDCAALSDSDWTDGADGAADWVEDCSVLLNSDWAGATADCVKAD